MDVRQLRYFVSVIELKSFSRAAEALHVAQPALGMQIRKLEDELHTQLLSRHSRGVEPTEAGNLLRDRAVEILRHVDATRQEIRDFSGPPRGVVQVGITPSTPPGITAELIQRATVELPTIQVVVQEAMNSTMLEWVRLHRVDFGLVYIAGDAPGELIADDLGREWAVFAQRREPGRQPPNTITLADVCRQPLVMPVYPHHLRRLMEGLAARNGLVPEICYEVESFSTIMEIVERGPGRLRAAVRGGGSAGGRWPPDRPHGGRAAAAADDVAGPFAEARAVEGAGAAPQPDHGGRDDGTGDRRRRLTRPPAD